MASTYEPIATTTLGSAQSSVTFGSGGTISQAYTDLVLVMNFTVQSNSEIFIRFNADSGTNYSRVYVEGNGSSASSNTYPYANANQINILGRDVLTTNIINIMNYSNTTTYKTSIARFGSASYLTGALVGLWRSTAAINQIDLSVSGSNFASGSTFTLYGIKAA